MGKFKFLCFATCAFLLIFAHVAYAEKIKLNEQYYQDGNYKIGMLNPVDQPFERYKPEEMTQEIKLHVSEIDDIYLTALYLNYYRTPDAPSFWDEDAASRGAVMAAVISTDVPMSEDFGFTKLSETYDETAHYRQMDIRYGLLVGEETYIYAFRFIRRGGDEYILVYRGPTAAEERLSPDDYFNTFKLVN